jgi:hypothetical protein
LYGAQFAAACERLMARMDTRGYNRPAEPAALPLPLELIERASLARASRGM